jgi:hypothetical protein
MRPEAAGRAINPDPMSCQFTEHSFTELHRDGQIEEASSQA